MGLSDLFGLFSLTGVANLEVSGSLTGLLKSFGKVAESGLFVSKSGLLVVFGSSLSNPKASVGLPNLTLNSPLESDFLRLFVLAVIRICGTAVSGLFNEVPLVKVPKMN